MEEKRFASSSSQPNMISPSSSFKPKLKDQDYMELACENGQILAKSRRPNNGYFRNRQRTQSLLDLYETEYYEGFKKNIKNLGDTQVVPVSESQPQQDKENDEQSNNSKKIKSSKIEFATNVSKSNKLVESSILIDDSTKGPKNVEVITTPPDEQSAAIGRSTELYFASSSKFSRGTSRDLRFCSLKRKHGDIEEEESTSLSNNSDDESDDAKTQVHGRTRKPVTKRKRNTEVHKLYERKRRDEFNTKMRALQELLPNCYKDDKASLLDEAIKYMRTLQLQVQIWECCRILVWRPLMLSRKFKKQGISGPRYRLLCGNIREIRKMKIEANLSVLDPNTNDIFPRVFPHYQQWISQYGETFLYWNGTEPTIGISDPELAKQILSSKLGFSVIPKSRPEILILFGKGVLAFTEGLDWVRHKTILKPAFSIDRLKFMTKSMVDCTLRMFEEWRKQSIYEETEQNLMKMEMKKEFSRLTTDIAATTEFGSSYAEEIEIFRAQIELRNCCVASLTKMFIPGKQYLPTPLNLRIRKLDRKVKNMIKRIIDARLKSKNYGDDLLGTMLNAATSEDSEKKMSIDHR